MDRDLEILFEFIADNLELLREHGHQFDSGIYHDICDRYGFDVNKYLEEERNRPGRFR